MAFLGINVTSYYLPTVLTQSVGLENSLARLLAACNSVSYLLFSLIGIPNVERWGRRKMMMYAAGQSLPLPAKPSSQPCLKSDLTRNHSSRPMFLLPNDHNPNPV